MSTFSPVLVMTADVFARRGGTTGPAIVLIAGGYVLARYRRRLVFSNNQWIVAAHILARAGGLAERKDLFDLLWGSDPDGGPLFARNILGYIVASIRPSLTLIGLAVDTIHGRGFRAVDLEVAAQVAA